MTLKIHSSYEKCNFITLYNMGNVVLLLFKSDLLETYYCVRDRQ